MKSIYRLVFAALISMGIVYAGQGQEQKHLLSISPSSSEVTSKSSFVFKFDMPILQPSVKKKSIVLKRKTPQPQKISTQFTVSGNMLTILPDAPLEQGIYVLKIKPLKLTIEGENTLQIQTSWQKFIAWLCGLFYKEISDCPLCRFFCTTSNTIVTKPIKYKFEIKDEIVKVKSIESNVTRIELSEHNQTAIKVMATYEDNTTEDVTQKATYTSSDSAVDVDKGVIRSNAEGSAVVSISYGGKSTTVQVEVYEMIEGHLLPHEPQNPDATLLGVDANHNGVRDDVERWIYKEMPTYHHPQIERVVAMQSAKSLQMALIDPTNKNDAVHKAIERAANCWLYYSVSRDLPFDGAVEKFNNLLDDKQFNTKERLKTYLEYDYTLKGRVFTDIPLRLLDTSYCDQNIDILP